MVPRCNHATILGFDQSVVSGLNQISECTSAVVYIALFSFLVGGLQKSKSLSVTVSPDVVSKASKWKNAPLPPGPGSIFLFIGLILFLGSSRQKLVRYSPPPPSFSKRLFGRRSRVPTKVRRPTERFDGGASSQR